MTQTQPVPPLVAIVTPVYNGEKYLAETMECVQALDYSRLVHIVLDNASADGTPEIISRYRNRGVPVVTFRNKSTIPIVANFNAAVGMVPTEARYFRLLCADDTMSPNAVSRQIEVAERNPDIDIVGCGYRILLCNLLEGFSDRYPPLKGLSSDRELFEGKDVIRTYLLREHWALSGTQALIRRSKLDDHAPFYDTRFHGAPDADANLRICLNSKFGFVHEELATWRQHARRQYMVFSRSKFDMLEWLTLLERYGPLVWNDSEYRQHRASYRRYYLRRLLVMRWRDGEKAAFEEHMTILRQNNDPASWLDFAHALAEGILRGLTRRPSVGGLARLFPRERGDASTRS